MMKKSIAIAFFLFTLCLSAQGYDYSIVTLPTPAKIEGDIVKDNATGKMKATTRFGDTFYYPADMKNGTVDAYRENRKVAEIPITNGLPHGEQKEFREDGTLENLVRFKDGKREGLSEHYKADGTLLVANTYKDGHRIGDYKFVKRNGILLEEGHYDDLGRQDGYWKRYYEDGKLMQEGSFNEGLEEGMHKQYYNDILTEETLYLKGKKNGISKTYDGRTGTIIKELDYREDKMIGYKLYYDNGSLFSSANEAVGTKTENTSYFEPGGKLINERKFSNGKPVGEHIEVMRRGRDSLFITAIRTYDNAGELIKNISYSGPEYKSYSESLYKNGERHGRQANHSAVTGKTVVQYYFEGKIVTEAEFKTLSKKKP